MQRTLSQLETTARRVVARDISIEVDVLEGGLTAYVDPVELERALFNLVLNASDAMPTGGKLHITCHREVMSEPNERLPEGRYVVLSMADDGQGMDGATLERIFEPFFTTKGTGTGLGLATVHAFAKAAGGDIQVTSEKGRGTTFTLFLPEHTEAGAEHEAPLPTPAAGESRRLNRRVLVVEDQAEVRTSIVRILTGHGLDTFEVADGDQAIEAVEEERDFAIMCIDGVMPGTGTAAVIERVAELSPATRVLVCSGYVKEDLVRRGIAMGKYAFLPKPFSTRQLLDAIQGLLSSSAPGQTSDLAATSGGVAARR
jgi:CheY-like chemotaxis protein